MGWRGFWSLTTRTPSSTSSPPRLRFAGYQVTTEQNGFDALRSIKNASPDLVVLDVNMPDLDGFEVCRRIRRDGHKMPVIFLTARDDLDGPPDRFPPGGDDYLTKPFSLEELSLRIEALLRRSKVASPSLGGLSAATWSSTKMPTRCGTERPRSSSPPPSTACCDT